MSRRKIFVAHADLLPQLVTPDGERLRIKGWPADARMIGVTPHVSFSENLMAFKVESQEFPDVRPGDNYPVCRLSAEDIGSE